MKRTITLTAAFICAFCMLALAARIVMALPIRELLAADVCFATFDDGVTVESSTASGAVQRAIDAAPPGSTVKIAGTCRSVSIVELAGGDICQVAYITKGLTLEGGHTPTDWNAAPDAVANPTILDAFGLGRVIVLHRTGASGFDVTLRHLILKDGDATLGDVVAPFGQNGGGIYVDGAITLTLEDSVVRESTADEGGGLYSIGTTTLERSSVADNSADLGGGVVNAEVGNLVVRDSTITGNTASRSGGLRDVASNTLGRSVRVENSTISGNKAGTSGSGVATNGLMEIVNSTIYSNTTTNSAEGIRIGTTGNVTLVNSIVGSNDTLDCFVNPGQLTIRHSIIEDGSCGITDGENGNIAADAQLGALANNGGSTLTHLPPVDSPAIDGADSAECPATDQRGMARSQTRCDIGAVELCEASITVTSTADSGAGSLREAVALVCDEGRVNFAGGMTVTLASSIQIDKAVQIDGASLDVTVSGNQQTRMFIVGPAGVVTLRNLTLADGLSDVGGAILNSGTLEVSNSRFMDNHALLAKAGGEGGAIFNNAIGSMNIADSSFMGNSSRFGGGAIGNDGSAEISNTTIHNNTAASGGGIASAGFLTLTASTISANVATADSAGGLANEGTSTLTNCTFSGNQAANSAGVGAILSSAPLSLFYCTVTGNSGGNTGAVKINDGDAAIEANIISGNAGGTADEVFFNPNASGIFISADNIFGDDSKTTAEAFSGFGPIVILGDFNATSDFAPVPLANIIDTTLANNGGPTLTHALTPVSPAVDRNFSCTVNVDQRGVARPPGERCSTGAVEGLGVPTAVTDAQGSAASTDRRSVIFLMLIVVCGSSYVTLKDVQIFRRS